LQPSKVVQDFFHTQYNMGTWWFNNKEMWISHQPARISQMSMAQHAAEVRPLWSI
jgi:hypothetical protein